MSRPPLLSIVIPAYNEEVRLPETLDRVAGWIGRKGLEAEIVVVDDGSTDGTVEVVEQVRLRRAAASAVGSGTGSGAGHGGGGTARGGACEIRLLRNPGNRGKGYSIRQGVLGSRGTWVLFTDADLSTPIDDYDRLYERATAGAYDMVIGSRGLRESNIELPQPFYRVMMGKTFNRIVRMMTGLPFHDTQCGFKLMAREKVRTLFERMVVDRFAFDVELLFLAHHAKLRIAEEPVTWRNSPVSKVGVLRDPLNMLRDIWRVRRRFTRGGYR